MHALGGHDLCQACHLIVSRRRAAEIVPDGTHGVALLCGVTARPYVPAHDVPPRRKVKRLETGLMMSGTPQPQRRAMVCLLKQSSVRVVRPSWAECFTGSLVALPVLAASPPAVPLLPLTYRWRGGGRPPPVLVTIGMPIAPSIRLPLGWPPDGVLACHPSARRGGERDGRALTPPRGAYAGHGQRDGLVVTAARHGGRPAATAPPATGAM